MTTIYLTEVISDDKKRLEVYHDENVVQLIEPHSKFIGGIIISLN